MKSISFDRGVERIELTDKYGDIIGYLSINKADSTLVEKFFGVQEKLTKISNDLNKEYEELKAKYGHEASMTDKEKDSMALNGYRIKIAAIKKCIAEVDYIFGKGTIETVFSENYKLNPDFVPDELAILEFIDAMIPVMKEIYGERMNTYQSRFNPNKRGRKTK